VIAAPLAAVSAGIARRLTHDAPEVRRATRDDVTGLHALITKYQAAGHLLPRSEDEIARHADRFVVIVDDGDIAGCAELAPLSGSVAEVRSLVVDEHLRGLGYGRHLVNSLVHEARAQGFVSLCAFTHDASYFSRLGFSLVPHAWLPEKISVDCGGCPLFRRCGQSAMRLRLDEIPAPVKAVRTYAWQ
jgi:N-acetylglutamate synthase-like GNAT family acetyltransferase